ncbi:serine hydrolase [Wenzhouxiangella sp. AB-CW3]|uniref:serine hydrolase domain-containing protein n=1 Tax=Wenzhouxiangella sp. AB-CW3 TaxID=2771012 RepID=UPI00168C0573|nr:serine hydrolase [Wenzhouxiangella sp. AB-CW3]QOC22303.1 serine hydrolase [Wenzhouxiangella sp. AB-CW3]
MNAVLSISRLLSAILPLGCLLAVGLPVPSKAFDAESTARIVERAESTPRLHALLVLHDGESVVEYVQGGPGLSVPANIKSVSKTVLSALGGIAIENGVVEGVDQSLVELLGERVPADVNSQVGGITFGHAMAMQTGLESTSGANYGRWVQSSDWVAHAISRPMVAEPGGRMIYSTGATHLAGAALVEASGESLLRLTRKWLGEPLNIRIPDWMQDPQGIHFGGNEMLMSPRALARFGEVYRLGGTIDGRQVIPAWWIERSWQANGRSPWTGDDYGYGWFITEIEGTRTYYGRGYGGQALFVIPEAALTITMTSDPTPPSRGGHFGYLRRLVADIVRAVH